MDDAEYLFHQTSKNAKRLARGAYAKKGGSRSKKCTLPSDKLSAKERKELNGKMSTYKMREPMTWKEFKALPDDLKKEYLQFLANEKRARSMDVAAMFGIAPPSFSNAMSKMFKGERFFGANGSKYADPKWLAFIAHKPSEDEPIPEHTEEPKAPESPPTRVKLDIEDDGSDLRNGYLCYIGKPGAVFQRAFEVLDKDCKYQIQINFLKEAE